MSATIGASLKKIAVSLLTDKKVIKTIGGIIIGVIIIVIMPTIIRRKRLYICSPCPINQITRTL